MAGNGERSARGRFAATLSRIPNFSRPLAIELTELKKAPPSLPERFLGTPRLPACWHKGLDRTIARLDQRGYDYEEIVARLRRIAPESIGQISPTMVERRLLALDQVVEIDYWRVGSQADSQYILDEDAWARTHRAEAEQLLRPKPSFWRRAMESQSSVTEEQLLGGGEPLRMRHLFVD